MSLVAALVAVLACAACSAPASQAKGGPGAVVIDERSDGGRVQASKGQLVRIELPATPGTGFVWVIVANDEKVLAPEGEPTFVSAPAPAGARPRVGGAELQVFSLRAKAPGTSRLELHRKRPFDPKAPPERRFRVTVEVR